MVSEFNFLKPGTQSPVFTLTSKEGNKVVSESLKGKYKYVQFWEPWSVPSIKEQLLIKKLYEKYGETIEFVSISSERWNELATKKAVPQYPWMFLFGTDQSTIFEDFRVRSVPTYLVLDKDNKIVQYPADSPVSIEKLLYEISMK